MLRLHSAGYSLLVPYHRMPSDRIALSQQSLRSLCLPQGAKIATYLVTSLENCLFSESQSRDYNSCAQNMIHLWAAPYC